MGDVGMVESGRRFRFANKALHPIALQGDVGWQHFQGDLTIELRVPGQIHCAHAA